MSLLDELAAVANRTAGIAARSDRASDARAACYFAESGRQLWRGIEALLEGVPR